MTKIEFASSPTAPKSLDLIVLIGIISPNKLQYYKDFPALSIPNFVGFFRTLNKYVPQRILRALQKIPYTTIQRKSMLAATAATQMTTTGDTIFI